MNSFNLIIVSPKIFIALMIIVILLMDAFIHKKNVITLTTLLTIVGAFILQVLVYDKSNQVAFNGQIILDNLAYGMNLVTYIASFIAVIYIERYIRIKEFLLGEFYAILLFAILGMIVMISANNLLILYIGLELLSLALYGLVAINRDNSLATEAAMKLFILSALASGLLLFGISFIYGATGGELQLNTIIKAIYLSYHQDLFIFGLVFIIAGLAFKLGLAPFHMWVPDVYQGATIAVTLIIGTISEIAAVVFMLRFLINGLVILTASWSVMLISLGCISLLLGNIVAIAQTNIKRMFAYSAIANLGFLVLGIATATLSGVSSALFYIITYVLTMLLGFGVLVMLSNKNFECENINDLKGLAKTNPLYAGILLLVMFSLAGIPPLAGFYAKFKILASLIALGHIYLAIYAVIMSLIGAFFYLRIVKLMYFDNSEDLAIAIDNKQPLVKITLIANAFMLPLLGLFPNQLINFCLGLIR